MRTVIVNLATFIVIAVIAAVWMYYGYIHHNPFAFAGGDYTLGQHRLECGFLGFLVSIVLTPIVRLVWLYGRL